MDNEDHFKQGQKACREYYASQAFSGLTRAVKAEQAIKLFLPPVEEQLIQVAMPLPKPRQKWLAGFKKEQNTMIAELEGKNEKADNN
jgi:hypothetical protein